MKAIAITPGQSGSAHLQELERPQAGPGELLVRVLETGICGTDLEINSGLYGVAPPGQDFLVLGHESFGRVEEVGSGLESTDWKAGDYIVSTVRRPCPENDPNCQKGQNDMCLTGHYTERGIKERHGYMTEFYTEQATYGVKIPAAFRPFGVLLEPTSVVEKAIFQAYKIQERLEWEPRRAVVFGAGPIGLLATFLLRSKGLEVFVVARSKSGPQNTKAHLVEQCGATYISSEDKPIEELKAHLGQIDFMLEATGNSEVAFKGLASLGLNGVMALTSVSGGHNLLPLDTNVLNLQLVLGNQVVFGSVNANHRYFEMGVADWANIEGQWPGLLQEVISRRLPLDQFKQALDKDRDGIKTVLQISPE